MFIFVAATAQEGNAENAWLKSYLPLTISITALLFTIATFYWNNWRTGRILVSQPRTFAAVITTGRALLLLPLAFRNTGPTALVVRALRIRFYAPSRLDLDYVRTRPSVKPEKGEMDFAINFVIAGREARVLCCEFEANVVSWRFPTGNHQVELYALLDRSERWLLVESLRLWFDPTRSEQLLGPYVTYDNRGALP